MKNFINKSADYTSKAMPEKKQAKEPMAFRPSFRIRKTERDVGT